MTFDPKMLAEIRKRMPQQIAEDLVSVQPMNDISIEDLKKAFAWLEASRIARGVHPITEEPLEDSTDN